MQRPDKRLVVTLVVAGALSLLVGLLFTEIVRAVPCQEERLACNIDQAIGAYAVPDHRVPDAPTPDAAKRPEENKTEGEVIPFPTE